MITWFIKTSILIGSWGGDYSLNNIVQNLYTSKETDKSEAYTLSYSHIGKAQSRDKSLLKLAMTKPEQYVIKPFQSSGKRLN